MNELPAMDRSLPKNGKLPWCPICGSPPEGDDDTYARCALPGCPLNQAYVDAKEWRSLVYKVVKDFKELRTYTSYPGMGKKKELSIFLIGQGEMSAPEARKSLGMPSPFFYADSEASFGPAILQQEIMLLWGMEGLPKQRELTPLTDGTTPAKGWRIEQKEAQVLINPNILQRGRLPSGMLGIPPPEEKPAPPPRERIDEWIGRLNALKASYGSDDAEEVKDAWQQRIDGDGYDDWEIQLLRVMEEEDK